MKFRNGDRIISMFAVPHVSHVYGIVVYVDSAGYVIDWFSLNHADESMTTQESVRYINNNFVLFDSPEGTFYRL